MERSGQTGASAEIPTTVSPTRPWDDMKNRPSALLFAARNFTLSREGQVTDRDAKAIEQLGSNKLDVREVISE
jgi:hypothetical protein